MPHCSPFLGLGVRHIQYVLLGWLIGFDNWFNALCYNQLMEQISKPHKDMDLSRKSKVISVVQKQVRALCYCCFAMGRLLSAFVVLRISCKYSLIIITSVELITVGVISGWFIEGVGFYKSIVIYALLAITRAFHWPCVLNLLSRWMSVYEITTANTIMVAIRDTFSIVFNFYIMKLKNGTMRDTTLALLPVHIAWIVLLLIFGADGPEKSFLLSKEEFEHLSKHIGPRKRTYCHAKIPWKGIFSTVIIYFWVICDFGRECANLTITDNFSQIVKHRLPSYTTVLLTQCGLVAMFVVIIGASVYFDRMIFHSKLTANNVRKIITSIGACGLCISMILTAYSPVQQFWYYMVSIVFNSIMGIGTTSILYDISPNYAVVFFSIFSFIRLIMLVGKFALDNHLAFDDEMEDTNMQFYRYGFLVFSVNLIFLLSGEIKTQPFDSYDTSDWRKMSLTSYP